jgi:hypothetical protein
MTLADSIARVVALVQRAPRAAVDSNALRTVYLQCTDDAYASALVDDLRAAVTGAVAAIEADAAFGDLATETTDALDALTAAAAACVATAGGQ